MFDVYPLLNIEPVRAQGTKVFTEDGKEYLDLYGGHAVISIGHAHPVMVRRLKEQMEHMIFYSNSVRNPLQQKLADKLEMVSGCEDYDLFLCNSGAEANENALKIASFATGRTKILAFRNGFHGRTSVALGATDNEKIKSPINRVHDVTFIDLNDKHRATQELQSCEYAAVIIEPVQGVGGCSAADNEFMRHLESECNMSGTVLISDEVQSGYGRTGKFFAFQHSDVTPQVISMAKGMGNGFPVAGILIRKNLLAPVNGMLGTTFGGGHLACQAALAVLEVIEEEDLASNAEELGDYLIDALHALPGVRDVRGRGLMIGVVFDFSVATLRNKLLYKHQILTGAAKDPCVLRILPPLNLLKAEADHFVFCLSQELVEIQADRHV